MTIPAPVPDRGASSINITSAQAASAAAATNSARSAREAAWARAKALAAPTPAPTLAPTRPRPISVTRTPAPERAGVQAAPIPAGAKPGRDLRNPSAAVPPGADEVRMSRREFDVLMKAANLAVDAQKAKTPPIPGRRPTPTPIRRNRT